MVYIHEIGIHATIAGVLLALQFLLNQKIEEKNLLKRQKEILKSLKKHR